MAQPPPTILALKQSFLQNQIRLLSRPLEPDQTWLDQNTASDVPLPASSIDEALHRLNQTLQKHARRVYPPQSTRIVAEQIDKLYYPDQTPIDEDEVQEDGPPIRGADLTSASTITALPSPSWPLEADIAAHPMEAARYATLAANLASLSARRAEVLDRVERLRRIQAALRPFAPAEDGSSALQENLVTRDGQVEKELEKMRMLLARVGGRIAALPDVPARRADADDDAMLVDSPAVAERKKVDGLMDLF